MALFHASVAVHGRADGGMVDGCHFMLAAFLYSVHFSDEP